VEDKMGIVVEGEVSNGCAKSGRSSRYDCRGQ